MPSPVWEKPGPLTRAEWEQVRLHAYHGERVLDRSPGLAVEAVVTAARGRPRRRRDNVAGLTAQSSASRPAPPPPCSRCQVFPQRREAVLSGGTPCLPDPLG